MSEIVKSNKLDETKKNANQEKKTPIESPKLKSNILEPKEPEVTNRQLAELIHHHINYLAIKSAMLESKITVLLVFTVPCLIFLSAVCLAVLIKFWNI